jgi:hypothetical protein
MNGEVILTAPGSDLSFEVTIDKLFDGELFEISAH